MPNILLTGAFGNIGTHTIPALLARGHRVRCFDLRCKANLAAARRYGRRIETIWGDLRDPDDLAAAVRDQDVVIHTGFVIPHLSATGMRCEDRPEWAREINVGGTHNLLQAMLACSKPPALIFTSSLHVYGPSQHMEPPRSVDDPLRPMEHYAHHKIECERMIRASGLQWAIFRLAAALPVRLILDAGMFEVPLAHRIEYVHGSDVGLALATAVDCPGVWGRTMHLGGGPRCQYYYRDLVRRVLSAAGVGMLPDEAFTTRPFSVDWLDTAESQRLLHYQHHTLDDYVADMRRRMGLLHALILLDRPLVRYIVLDRSPYLRDKYRQSPWQQRWANWARFLLRPPRPAAKETRI